jgi:hypothetical protein
MHDSCLFWPLLENYTSTVWKALDENSISSLCFIFTVTVTKSRKEMALGARLAQKVGIVLKIGCASEPGA